jgi:alpha-1,3-glucosyltransferase
MFLSTVVSTSKLRNYYHLYHADGDIRYPKSIFHVIVDSLERVYLAGFPFLLLFVSTFPYLQTQSESVVNVCISSSALVCPDPQLNSLKSVPKSSAMEFLPLMATSIYCALGLVWSFMRLGFIYLYEETSYQGQPISIQ